MYGVMHPHLKSCNPTSLHMYVTLNKISFCLATSLQVSQALLMSSNLSQNHTTSLQAAEALFESQDHYTRLHRLISHRIIPGLQYNIVAERRGL